jgi:hypothetical protein
MADEIGCHHHSHFRAFDHADRETDGVGTSCKWRDALSVPDVRETDGVGTSCKWRDALSVPDVRATRQPQKVDYPSVRGESTRSPAATDVYQPSDFVGAIEDS